MEHFLFGMKSKFLKVWTEVLRKGCDQLIVQLRQTKSADLCGKRVQLLSEWE